MVDSGGRSRYSKRMTALQQALAHLVLVTVALVAIVVLQVTGNLTTVTGGLVLAITGFGNIATAGLPTAPQPQAPTAVKDTPVVVKTPVTTT